jgi:membrane associated rhomboid family serine protease
MKRIINFVPFITITLVVAMYMGMHYATRGTGHVVDYSWASTPGEWFTISNVKALFGHVDMSHFLNNAIIFALFTIPAEICLGSRKFLMLQVSMIMLYYIVDTGASIMFHLNPSMGASGWAMMAPGIMMYCAAHCMNKHGVSLAAMSAPATVYAISLMCASVDIKALRAPDGVSHESHLIGYAVGSMLILVAVPFFWRAGKIALAEFREQQYWEKRKRLSAMKWQLEDYHNGRLQLAPRIVKRYEKALAAG